MEKKKTSFNERMNDSRGVELVAQKDEDEFVPSRGTCWRELAIYPQPHET